MCRAKNSSTPTIRQQGGELLRWLRRLAVLFQIADGVQLAQLERYLCLRLGMSAIQP